MLLRRVIEHVRRQEWTAIGIDFVIVVVGVFVGIQVSNWNAARLEEVKAQAYVERIKDNLLTDLKSIERRDVFWRKVMGYGQDAVRYAETGARVQGSAWKTVLAFYQASQLWPWVTTDTTYQELKSSGELGLLRDEGLRAALASYYLEGSGKDADYILALNPEYRKIVRGLTPAVASNQIWTKCHRVPSNAEQYLLDCESPMPEAQAQQVLDTYLKDPRLLSELRFWVATQQVALSMLANNKTSVMAMLKRMSVEPAP